MRTRPPLRRAFSSWTGDGLAESYREGRPEKACKRPGKRTWDLEASDVGDITQATLATSVLLSHPPSPSPSPSSRFSASGDSTNPTDDSSAASDPGYAASDRVDRRDLAQSDADLSESKQQERNDATTSYCTSEQIGDLSGSNPDSHTSQTSSCSQSAHTSDNDASEYYREVHNSFFQALDGLTSAAPPTEGAQLSRDVERLQSDEEWRHSFSQRRMRTVAPPPSPPPPPTTTQNVTNSANSPANAPVASLPRCFSCGSVGEGVPPTSVPADIGGSKGGPRFYCDRILCFSRRHGLANALGCSDEALEALAASIEEKLGCERVPELLCVPDRPLLRVGVPAAFCQVFRHLSASRSTFDDGTKDSASESSDLAETERFIWARAFAHGLTAEDTRNLLRVLLKEHWVFTLENLWNLDETFLRSLGRRKEFAQAGLWDRVRSMLRPPKSRGRACGAETRGEQRWGRGVERESFRVAKDEAKDLELATSLVCFRSGCQPLDVHVAELLQRLASANVRCTKDLLDYFQRLDARDARERSREDSSGDRVDELNLPAAFVTLFRQLHREELRRDDLHREEVHRSFSVAERRDSGDVSDCGSAATHIEIEESGHFGDYKEPTAEDFINRVGSKHDHSHMDISHTRKILLQDNWIRSLSRLRQLTAEQWNEFRISPTTAEDLRNSLYCPEILGMTCVHTGDAPLNNFSVDVQFAVHMVVSELDTKTAELTCRQLIRFCECLVVDPTNTKYRRINKTNPNTARFLKYQSSRPFFSSLGFLEYDTCFLLPVNYVRRNAKAHEELLNHLAGASPRSSSASKNRLKLGSFGFGKNTTISKAFWEGVDGLSISHVFQTSKAWTVFTTKDAWMGTAGEGPSEPQALGSGSSYISAAVNRNTPPFVSPTSSPSLRSCDLSLCLEEDVDSLF